MTNRIDDFQSEIALSGGAAVTNLWRVVLPPLGYDGRSLNLLCRATQTPARNINQTELAIGLNRKQVANGFGVTPISMNFLVLNDPFVLEYFEKWQSLAIDQNSYEVGYYEDYTFPIQIDVLQKGKSLPIFQRDIPGLNRVPSFIRNRIPNIGPINFRQGEIDLDLVLDDSIVYSYKLLDAYPSAFTGVNLDNNQIGGFFELSVQFTYRDWTSTYGENRGGDKFGKAIDGLVDGIAKRLGF